MNTSQPPSEKTDLVELLKLLKETFSGSDTKKINDAKDKIKHFFSDLRYGISLLFNALCMSEFNNKPIPLDLHKSIAIYLKNIFYAKLKQFPD